MKIKKVLLSYMKPKNREQKKNFDKIIRVLKKNDISVKLKERDSVTCKDFDVDVIMTLGGDGTFLRTVHCIKDDTPILGINLDVKRKEGGLLQSNASKFEKHLKMMLSGKAKTIKLTRLEAKINRKNIGLALNEFYIGFQKAYHTARYEIIHSGKKEYQKSSGLLVGTAAGSTGWTKSAGGRILPLASKRFQLVAREVFCSRLSGCSMKSILFKENESVRIRSDMDNGIIVADSVDIENRFKKKDVIEIKASKKPVSYFVF